MTGAKRRFLVTTIIAVCMLAGLMPPMVSVRAEETTANAAAARDYLNAYYRDGAAGLEFLYGSDDDRAVLQKLAEVILAGAAETGESGDGSVMADSAGQQAQVISEWVRDNIDYIEDDGKASAVAESAIDTFYRREARCFGIAQLISQLLRIRGIPAAVGVGRRSAEAAEPEEIREGGDGHAWVYVCTAAGDSKEADDGSADGTWSIYDPCYDTYGLSDEEEISHLYYLEEIEGITPVCDGITPDTGFYWENGILLKYKDGQPAVTVPGQSASADGKKTRFAIYRGIADGSGVLRTGLIESEDHYSASFGRTNGLLRINDVCREQDRYLVYGSGGRSVSLSSPAGSRLYFWNGKTVVEEGAAFSINPFPEGFRLADDEQVTFESDDPAVLTVDPASGRAQALAAGTTMVHFTVKETGTAAFERHYGSFPVRVIPAGTEYGRDYIFEYRKESGTEEEEPRHEHSYQDSVTPAQFEQDGEIISVCTECGDEVHKGVIDQIDSLELSAISYYYDGSPKTPPVKAMAGGKELEAGTDYEVTYPEERTDPGVYQVTVTFGGNYAGTHTLTYRILNANIKKIDDIVASLGTRSEVPGSVFRKLRARVGRAGKNSVTIRWKQIPDASGYVIYRTPCGSEKGYTKKFKAGSGATSFTDRKLKKARYYKYLVTAVGNENGDEVILSVSKAVHAVTAGGKYANTAKVTVRSGEERITLKAGGKKTVHPARKMPAGKKKAAHRKMSYESSNGKVASVSASGCIKGLKKGRATIYCYAHDGIYKTVKVTVK